MTSIQTAIADGVATLTLARPQLKNALNAQMGEELGEALASLRRDPDVRALVLTGAGGDFCSGGDISNMQGARGSEAAQARMSELHRVYDALLEFDRPVIATVDGVAFGAGFSLALAADFVLASQRARFCLSFARVGLLPDLGALHMLPRLIGMQRTKELVYSARELPAQEAVALGLVLEVLPAPALQARALEIAAAMAQVSPFAFAKTKQLLARSFETDRRALLGAEASAQAIALESDYTKEAVGRFMRREPARFQWPLAPDQKKSTTA